MYGFSMTILNTVFPSLELISAAFSGVLTGALLTEARVLVPYWRKMSSHEFLQLHHTMAPSLFQFFAPITIAGTMLPTVAAVCSLLTQSATAHWWAVSASLGLALLAIYFAYFKHANKKFETGNIAEADLPKELSKWAFWHNLRTTISVFGFLAALIATQY